MDGFRPGEFLVIPFALACLDVAIAGAAGTIPCRGPEAVTSAGSAPARSLAFDVR